MGPDNEVYVVYKLTARRRAPVGTRHPSPPLWGQTTHGLLEVVSLPVLLCPTVGHGVHPKGGRPQKYDAFSPKVGEPKSQRKWDEGSLGLEGPVDPAGGRKIGLDGAVLGH